MTEAISQPNPQDPRQQWGGALVLSREAQPKAPIDLALTTPITFEDGETVEIITEDNVLAFGEATGRTWTRLRSAFSRFAESCDYDESEYKSYRKRFVDEKNRTRSFVGVTPDHLAYLLEKHGRYGVAGASEKTTELLADLLAHLLNQGFTRS